MVRELAILGFVSFTATVLLQFVDLPGEGTKEQFEYSHVLMFITAIFYAIEIAVVSAMLERVCLEFEEHDNLNESELHAEERKRVERAEHGLGPTEWLKNHLLPSIVRHSPASLRRKSVFKVLKFHFMSRNDLLGSKAFKWAKYLEKTIALRIEELIEINVRAWALLILCVGVASTFEFSSVHTGTALYIFLGFGWMLCLAEYLLLGWSESVIDWLVVKGYQHRTAAQVLFNQRKERLQGRRWGSGLMSKLKEAHPGSFRNRSSEMKKSFAQLMAIARGEQPPSRSGSLDAGLSAAQESVAKVVVDRWSDASWIRKHELGVAIETNETATKAQELQDAMLALKEDREACEEAEAHVRPGFRLKSLPIMLQLCLLLQCMYQGLVLTMLGRLVVLELSSHPFFAVGCIVLMWAPTTIMSILITPHLIKNVAMCFSVVEASHSVLLEMEREFMHSGDYSSANEALELVANMKLTAEDMADEETVRTKVRSLIKLAEMKWRYRVVEAEESPREEGLRVLGEALDIAEAYKEREASAHAAMPREKMATKFRLEWAEELSDIKQGQAVARLIFNTDRSEDDLIEELLTEALELRRLANMRSQMADTMNGLGSLKQKQKRYDEAEKMYKDALEIRLDLPEGDDKGKAKQQSIAQSLVSLGNLHIELGDAASAAGRLRDQAMGRYSEALANLSGAKVAYERAFATGHPKVAWALEGMGRVYRKMGDLRRAEEQFEEAIAIRRQLQSMDDKKELFKKELRISENMKSEVEEKRGVARSRLQRMSVASVLSEPGSRPLSSKLLLAAKGASLAERSDATSGSSDLQQPLLNDKSKVSEAAAK